MLNKQPIDQSALYQIDDKRHVHNGLQGSVQGPDADTGSYNMLDQKGKLVMNLRREQFKLVEE